MKEKIFELFPTPFFISKIEVDSQQLKSKINAISDNSELISHDGYEHPYSDQLFQRSEFLELRNTIQKYVDYFLREVMLCRYDESYFSCSWYNINKPNSTHHRHYHPNSIISGVLFVCVPPNSGQLVFISPNINRDVVPDKKINVPQNKFSSATFCPVQEAGTLVLFPSFVEHQVSKNESDENRYTISFNVFVKGHLGNSRELTYCRLG
jgi:uncharacterized protein (TIGR02466 family)